MSRVAALRAVAIRRRGLTVDGPFVYFTENTPTGRVAKVAKSGGPPTVLAEKQGAPGALAVDETSIYWNCGNDGTINKMGK